MMTTLAVIMGLSTLFFTVALSLLSAFDFLTLTLFVVAFNLIQWLIAPYIVDTMYSTHEVSIFERRDLYDIVERVS